MNQQAATQKQYPQEDDDDVSYDDKSFASAELSVDNSKQNGTAPTRQLISEASFNEGVSRVRSHWRVLASGQVLSFFLATSGAMASSLYYECNISMPTTQTAVVFLFMSFHLVKLSKKYQASSHKKSKSLFRVFRNTIKNDKGRREHKQNGQHINPADLVLGASLSLDSHRGVNAINTGTGTSTGTSQVKHHSLCGLIHISIPLWVYFIVSLLFVEATYLSTLALRYTSLASAGMLDNINIFAAMIASRIILKRRYSWKHMLGATICFLGVGINIFTDFKKGGMDAEAIDDQFVQMEELQFPNPLVGDLLAVTAGVFFGVCDVVIEGILKTSVGGDEYLGCTGFLGFLIAFTQALIIERDAISKFLSPEQISMDTYADFENPYDAPRTCSQKNALLLFIGYVVTAYLFINGVTRFLIVSESALLMISTLTADLWSVLFTVIAQHIMPSGLFYLGLGFVILGIVLYEMSPSPLGPAEDMQIHKEIEMDQSHDMFAISSPSLSWESKGSKEIV